MSKVGILFIVHKIETYTTYYLNLLRSNKYFQTVLDKSFVAIQ